MTCRARKTDAGTRSFKTIARSDVTEADAGAFNHASGSCGYYQDICEADPDTDVAWTEAGVDAAEFGIKITA